MRIQLSDLPLERAAADLLALAVTSEDVVASTTLRRLERALRVPIAAELARRRFKARERTSVLLGGSAPLGRRHLAIIGLGSAAALGPEAWRRAADQLVTRAREVGARRAALAFARVPPDAASAVAASVEGAMLASYTFRRYRHDPERVTLRGLVISGLPARDRALGAAARRATILARATNQARDWINTPAAAMSPSHLAAEAKRAGRAAGLTVQVSGRKDLRKLGMAALLAVAQGSAEKPRFIRIVYRPPDAARRGPHAASGSRVPGRRAPKRIALVGKGITFDSGGLSLKPADAMEHMKRDMAGGAAVIAAMTAIAALRPAVEVRAYVPACENMPGGGAMKPGDVVRTAAGKTIEVLNTDAEGRLVLADALAIALRDEPDLIIDIATLTGAVRTALGTRIAAVMGNDARLVSALVAAGETTGERVWELPLVAAYRADLESTVADYRNVAPDGYGGSIHAGLLLQEFVGGRPWAHLDIAGVAFTDRDLPWTPRGGTGFGVRLLTECVLRAAETDL